MFLVEVTGVPAKLDMLSENRAIDGAAAPTRGKYKHDPSKHKLLKIPGPAFVFI